MIPALRWIYSDESHFNDSAGSDGHSHKTVSTNHNLFEEKGEPKRYRTQVLRLTSLTARPNRLTPTRLPAVRLMHGGPVWLPRVAVPAG